jgi:hypothetical protein
VGSNVARKCFILLQNPLVYTDNTHCFGDKKRKLILTTKFIEEKKTIIIVWGMLGEIPETRVSFGCFQIPTVKLFHQ